MTFWKQKCLDFLIRLIKKKIFILEIETKNMEFVEYIITLYLSISIIVSQRE